MQLGMTIGRVEYR